MEGKDVEVEWIPFELRPEPVPTLDPNSDYIRHAWHESVKPISQKLGVEMNLPPVQPRTHLAFEGFQYAKEHGKANDYNHRISQAFFVEGRDIGQLDVLVDLAEEIGLNGTEYRAALESRKYKERHQEALRNSTEQGIRAVPTFMIGERKLQGLYPADRLSEIIDEELNKQPGKIDVIEGPSSDIEGC